MFKRHIAATSLAFALMSATAIAQTSAPAPSAAPTAPSATAAPAGTSTTVAPANMSWQGKWRSTQLIGVDVYGPNNEKVGDVTEVIFDRTGKIEMVTVGVGGFLGIGQKDVAIPFSQVNWSDQPIASASAAPAGGTAAPAGGMAAPATGTAAPATGTAGTATGTASTARAPMLHPDHGKITLTKEQLTSAPAVNYSGT